MTSRTIAIAGLSMCLLLGGRAFALPPCPAEEDKAYHACFGTYVDPSGDKYVGEFMNDNYNGQGTYYSANGDRYVGSFRDGAYEGKGTLYYADGDIYSGSLSNNLYHGWGVYIWADGDKEAGFYEEGELVRAMPIQVAALKQHF
jgi:hypothetical protein